LPTAACRVLWLAVAAPIFRDDFKKLTSARLRDARALLKAGQWAGAFYLLGYAVECGLKACIAKAVRKHEFPDKDRAQAGFKHKLTDLVQAAGLQTDLQSTKTTDASFKRYWDWIAGETGWSEQSRYRWDTLEGEARDLYKAVADPKHGVLRWIRKHW